MKREFTRIYRQYGIKYFGAPVIVVLCLGVIFDKITPEYIDKLQKNARITEMINRYTTVLDKGKDIEKNSESLTASYKSVESFFLRSNDRASAADDFQGKIRNLLESLYFSNIEFLPSPIDGNPEISPISSTVRFLGVPQQLPRLEAALATHSIFMSSDLLDIRVVDDHERGGQQLLISARFSSLYLRRDPPVIAK